MKSTNTHRVILVEDQDLLRSILCEYLSDAGFNVDQASSADAAMAVLNGGAGEDLACLVTDIDLGLGPKGWVLAERAREIRPDLPVIYMSGASIHEWTTHGVKGSRMIAKPFTVDRLIASLHELTADDRLIGPALED